MALFDRNDDRGYGWRDDVDRGRGRGFMDRAQNAVRRGWDRMENAFEGQDVHRGRDYGMDDEHLRRDYESRSTMDTGAGYGGGMGRGWSAGGYGRPMDREGGLHQRNSWSDGAWTADAAERTDREWNLPNRGRHDFDREDTTPFQAGWRAGGMHPRDRERNWNLGGGDREWGHNWGGGSRGRYDRGYVGGGMGRGGGFMDRAQGAVRRGWDRVEDAFDRDDDRHLGSSSMRGGTSWAGRYDRDWHEPSDVRGYRDEHGHYGLTHAPGMMGGNAGMSRYGSDFDRGMHRGDWDRGDRLDYDRGYKTHEQTDAGDPFGDRASHTPIRVTGGNRGLGRYDDNFRGRDWF